MKSALDTMHLRFFFREIALSNLDEGIISRIAHVGRARVSRKVFLVTPPDVFAGEAKTREFYARTLSRFKSFSPARKCRSKEAIHEGAGREEKGAFPECAMRSWTRAGQKFSRLGTKVRTKARHGPRTRLAPLPFRSLGRKLRSRRSASGSRRSPHRTLYRTLDNAHAYKCVRFSPPKSTEGPVPLSLLVSGPHPRFYEEAKRISATWTRRDRG